MKWPLLSSIRARMTALFGVGAALLMTSSALLLLWNARREAEISAQSSLQAAAFSLRQPLESGAGPDKIKEILTNHNARVVQGGWANEVEAWFVGKDGTVKWRTGPFRPPHLHPRDGEGEGPPPEEGFGDGRRGGFPRDEGRDGPPFDGREPRRRGPRPPWMELAVPPREDRSSWRHIDLRRGDDTLILGVPWFRNSRVLQSEAVSLLVLGLLSSSAAAVGAWFLVGKVLTPIERLAGQARGLAQDGSFEGRLTATSSDQEMRHLTSTLNEMLRVLGEAARSKERFHTAASHELRTPLQALSGHLQVALSRFRGADEYRVALEEAARQTERLSSLTRDLLMLNQLQMASSKPPSEHVDATEVLEGAIDRAIPALEERAVQVEENLAPCEVETAPSHIDMLVRNLVENSVKYAPNGGRISFEIGQHELSIWNQTEVQLRDVDLARLFEPFFRPDASRHSSTGGNGLGLSICHAICEANGWSIELKSEDRQGAPGVLARVRFSLDKSLGHQS